MAGERNDPKEVIHSLTDCEMKLQDQKAERSGGLEPYGLRVSTKTRKEMGGVIDSSCLHRRPIKVEQLFQRRRL